MTERKRKSPEPITLGESILQLTQAKNELVIQRLRAQLLLEYQTIAGGLRSELVIRYFRYLFSDDVRIETAPRPQIGFNQNPEIPVISEGKTSVTSQEFKDYWSNELDNLDKKIKDYQDQLTRLKEAIDRGDRISCSRGPNEKILIVITTRPPLGLCPIK